MQQKLVGYEDISKAIEKKRSLGFEDLKYSYVILKPNSEKHFSIYIEELEKQKFNIVDCFAIFDYETVNMALHPTDEVKKYIIPISRLYNDFYSNYAILIIIAKNKISYDDFCTQVYRFKRTMRDMFSLDYVSFAFDTAKIGRENKEESLKIIAKDGAEVKKDNMNDPGTYMIFTPNEIHSPDGDVETTIKELELLIEIGIISPNNSIPKPTKHLIAKYGTYSFLEEL